MKKIGDFTRPNRHPYCGVFKLKKAKNKKKTDFRKKKPDFPVRIRIRWYGNIRGVTLRSQEVHRSKKSEKKKIPEKPDFPDPDEPDPDFILWERLGGRGLPVAKIADL